MKNQIRVKQFLIITIVVIFTIVVSFPINTKADEKTKFNSIKENNCIEYSYTTKLPNNNKNIKDGTSDKNIKIIRKTKKRTRIKKRKKRSSSKTKIRNKNYKYNVIVKPKKQKKIISGISCEFQKGIVVILDIIRNMLTAKRAEAP